MKIAFLSQYFHPETFSNNAIAQDLVKRGHEVNVVACVPNYPAGRFFDGYSNRERREEEWSGAHVTRAWTWPRGRRAISLLTNYLVYPVTASWSLLAKRHRGTDVSFVSMPSPLFQAIAGIVFRWRTGTPCVIWVQDLWPESAVFTLGLRNPLIVRPLSALCGWIYRRADLVLVQSPSFTDRIVERGVDRDRIRVFPNAAPDGYVPMTPAEAPEAGALVPREGFRLMFAGNIGESQDFDTIVAAAERLTDHTELTWVIVGSGRDMDRVRDLIARKGLDDRFAFLGRHPSEDMPRFFAHADAMLVSLKDTPIFGLTVPYKIQGYMACAKPIVASLNGTGAEIVEAAGCGVTAPASSPDAVRRMLDTPPAERDAMGRRAKEWCDTHYRPEKIYGDLERWLQEVANS